MRMLWGSPVPGILRRLCAGGRWLGQQRWNTDGSWVRRRKPVRIVADLAGSDLLYGLQPVEAALRQRRRELYGLYVPRDYDGDLGRDRLERVVNLARMQDLPIARVPTRAMTEAVNGQPHQGVILKTSRYDPPRITRIWNFADGKYEVTFQGADATRVVHHPRRELPLWVALDRIQDARNLGSIIRSALFFGADAVLTPHEGVCGVMSIVSKVSCGAAECANVYRTANMPLLLDKTRKQGWSIVCATSGDSPMYKAVPIGQVPPLTRPTILVIGSEESGVSDEIARLSDMNVQIPPCGELPPFVDSLNAGVAAGVLLASLRFKGE